ncbi:MAG: dephospho-CoA kinase [Pseudomonadota bacterium]|jgi:dephospho-CoA kinase
MIRIALTGGIASGKSAVAALFEAHGVPVIDSDVIARDVVAPGSPALAAIRRRFGDVVLQSDGSLDRRALREQVFADPTARRDLETITHPAIRERMQAWSQTAPGPYQIHMIPLLVESGGRRDFDRVLVVDCPEALQIQRVMQRDGVDASSAQKVLDAQASRAERLAIADDVIVNDGDRSKLSGDVDALHERYLKLSVYATKAARSE